MGQHRLPDGLRTGVQSSRGNQGRQAEPGTEHVQLRGPLPEPPAEDAMSIPAERQPDGSVTFETQIAGLDGLSDEQVPEQLAPGTELVLGEDGTWRVVEPDADCSCLPPAENSLGRLRQLEIEP
jgi:hypothetical protein